MKKWLAVGIVGIVVLILALLLGGGIYRTVNAGGGTFYIINRFTGKIVAIRNGVETRLKSESEVAKEQARHNQEAEDVEVKEKLQQISDAASAADASYIGDPVSKLYHKRPFVFSWDTQSPSDEIRHVASIRHPVYLSSVLEAANKGYWPCQTCLPSAEGKVLASVRTVRLWPRPNAPVDFTLKPGECLTILGKHGDFYAVSTERVATGERSIGWIAKSEVLMDIQWGREQEYANWKADRREALKLRKQGLSVTEIAKRKGWKDFYVYHLLSIDENSLRQSPPF